MGWNPAELNRREFLILSTQGGIRAPDGSPVALGYHTGHWEVGLLMKAAAEELKTLGAIPFAGYCTDPCDGRTQGTVGMMDSLPYRNDAAMVLRRLMRSLPTRSGVLGVATCDKGLPAMMMALASQHDYPVVLVPGGVMLAGAAGDEVPATGRGSWCSCPSHADAGSARRAVRRRRRIHVHDRRPSMTSPPGEVGPLPIWCPIMAERRSADCNYATCRRGRRTASHKRFGSDRADPRNDVDLSGTNPDGRLSWFSSR